MSPRDPSGGARQALGARPSWRFPIAGPQRVVAIRRLRQAIADDVVAHIDGLAAAGWRDAAEPDVISILAGYWHGIVAEGIGEGLDRLGVPERGECSTCFAQVSGGRCWGCGAAPSSGA